MRVKSIETYALRQELGDESFSYSQYWYNQRTVLVVKITTESGLVGWGECFGPVKVNKTIIDEVYAPIVIGKDVFDTEVIWNELYNVLRDHGQRGVVIESISGIDIALWDIKGQILKQPVYKLMGGASREKIMPYATGFYRNRDKEGVKYLIDEAVDYLNQGFKAMKIKTGFGLDYDEELVKAIRAEVGDDVLLMIDPNHAYNANTAIKMARRLEKYDIFWLEEPVPPEDIEGYKEVKSKTTVPIAGGEASFSRYDFNTLLSNRCVDIVQPDCCVIGGISEFLKIVTLATIHNIQCYPHIWGSGIALSVGINCAFALPNFPPSLTPSDVLLEYDRTPNVFREKLNRNMPKIVDGYISMPQKSGLGLDIDEDIIKKYIYK